VTARREHRPAAAVVPGDDRGGPTTSGDRRAPRPPAAIGAGLLEKLVAAVRPEFRNELLAPASGDPVLGWKICAAGECGRAVFAGTLCAAHSRRWRRLGRPDVTEFLASPGPAPRGRGGAAVIDCRNLAPQLKLELPYMRYYNTKMRREAAVPIDEELAAGIRAQQDRVARRWPGGNPNLFPRSKANVSGKWPLSSDSYRRMLERWLATCDVRDEHGQPVHLTAHQWRHTFACRLVNRDVPQEVIGVLLDHESNEMTAHYARITDQTVRRHWERAARVNINGERVTLDPDGPLSQAQWARTRYGMATQTLANGYCGLPVQKSCPHANACLTCPVFVSGPEFLPELQAQRHRTLTLIEVSSGQGQARVTEMNQQVLTSLDRMISEIEKSQEGGTADAG
jgi:hypothetical protein